MDEPSNIKKRVLILCTGNSCRSQMAEGCWRKLGGDKWDVFSAGSKPVGFVHPLAVEAMREVDVDLSAHTSKHVDEFVGQPFDLVVTVCDSAREACPTLPGAKRIKHWPFEDPAAAGDDRLAHFRRVRDEIAEAIRTYLAGS